MVGRFLASIALTASLAPIAGLDVPAAEAAERTLRVVCRDGAARARVAVDGFVRRLPVCDFDGQCNGSCRFAFCSLGTFLCATHPLCLGGVGPGSGLCVASQPPTDEFTVPVDGKRVLDDVGFGTQVILRCRKPLARRCPCSLTDGEVGEICGGRCPDPRQQCRLDAGLEGAPPGCACLEPCEIGADCDDQNACTSDTCVDGVCRHTCECFGALDCCPGPGCASPSP